MKIIIAILALFTVNISIAQTSGQLKFFEITHGVAQVLLDSSVDQKNSPTGKHGILKEFEITNVTDSVVTEIGSHFGVEYIIKAKDTVNVPVAIEWVFPGKIVDDKGEKFKSVKYTTTRPTNIPSASSYSLDKPFELVKGNWKINIYLEDKVVYSRTFILY